MPEVDYEVYLHVPAIEVLKGCLCLSYREMTHFLVWTMREFGVAKSWTLLLNINIEDLYIHVWQ